jgi:excisionase family DNA binding protein
LQGIIDNMREKKSDETSAEMLTISEAAKELGVSLSTISHAIRRGKIGVVRFKHLKLIPRAALEQYAKTRKVGRPVGWRKYS